MTEDEYIEKLVVKHNKILNALSEEYPNTDWEELLPVAALLMIADGLDDVTKGSLASVTENRNRRELGI